MIEANQQGIVQDCRYDTIQIDASTNSMGFRNALSIVDRFVTVVQTVFLMNPTVYSRTSFWRQRMVVRVKWVHRNITLNHDGKKIESK